MKRALTVSAFWFTSLLTACGGSRGGELLVPAADLQNASCVAVLALNNETKTAGGGEAFAEQIAFELRRAGFQVMDRAEAMRILAHHRIYLNQIANEEEASALGDILGVQAVVYGNLTRYDWESAEGQAGLTAVATAEVKLVEVESGKLFWRGTFTGDGRRSFGPRPAPLYAAAGDASVHLAAALTNSMIAAPAIADKVCWEPQAKSVLAALAPDSRRPGTPTPTTTGAPTPKPTPKPAVKLTAAQRALRSKLAAGGSFVLEGVTFSGLTQTLAPGASSPIVDMAAVLKAYPGSQVKINGYMDALDKNANDMSLKRAEVVMAKLVALGAGKAQLTAKGLAGSNPRMPSFTEITRAKNRRIEVQVVSAPKVKGQSKPRVKIVAAPGGQLGALQLHTVLKNNASFEVDKKVTQTRTKRPTTIYYRPGRRKVAAKIAKAMSKPPRARVSDKLPSGVDVYIVVGGGS